MTKLDVQVYEDLLMRESKKLTKAACKNNETGSPPSEEKQRIQAKNEGILMALHLLKQVQEKKSGKVLSIRKKLVLSGKFSEEGNRIHDIPNKSVKKANIQVPEWLGGFEPEKILSAESEVRPCE